MEKKHSNNELSCSSLQTSFYQTPITSPNQSFDNGQSTSDQISDISSSSYHPDQCQFFSAVNSLNDNLNSIYEQVSSCDSISTLVPNQKINNVNNNISISANELTILFKKFNNFIEHVKLLQMDCSKILTFEKQIIELYENLKQFKEKFIKDNLQIIQYSNELTYLMNSIFTQKNFTDTSALSSSSTFSSNSIIESEKLEVINSKTKSQTNSIPVSNL